MSSFPGSPRTLRAALVSVDLVTRAQTVIAFQYNPHTLTRSVASKGAEAGPSCDFAPAPKAFPAHIPTKANRNMMPDATAGLVGLI